MPRSFTLSTQAVDVLAEDLAINLRRFPFEFDHHGSTADERSGVRSEVYAELSRRGLLDREEPDQDLEAALRLLHAPRVEIAVTYVETATEEVFRARTAVSGRTGVQAVQHPDTLRITFIDPRGIARLSADLLPEMAVGKLEAATIPASDGGGRHDEEPEQDEESWLSTVETTATKRRGGRDTHAAQHILTRPTHRIGYFFVSGRDDSGETVRMSPVGWRDTDSGRYSVTTRRNNDGAEWNTFAGADKQRLAGYLAEQLDALTHG
ncbi:ESX secretion-associated protein EspG [Actinopolyspora mortivallis]|uniref:ESX secretion-associated protein EspG n=1 Tax=Actinopolyspora mortivallis TaxID=33906 RepID=A0A2T0GVT5_ACTMO|nr:ESX secretion-associated protein EspG [Actinopolyspora mortivallis]PRW63236.1 ESX secretion-associated protein EspG [Actinopolyspora mortivallis]